MGKYEDTKLRVFVTAARLGNFTQAARRLGITQPAVSQQVSDLEKVCGKPLFVRGRGEVALTPAGEVFLRYAERILDTYGEADAMFGVLTAAGRSAGRISVATTAFCATYVLPSLVGEMEAVSGLEVIKDTYPEAEFISVMPPTGYDIHLFTVYEYQLLDAGLERYAQSSLRLPSGDRIHIILRPSPAFSGSSLYRILVERLLQL